MPGPCASACRKVAEIFKAGDIDYRMFQTMVYRTDLITDPDVLAAVDAELAVKLPRWPSMTRGRLAGQVDKIVARADADAVRQRQQRHADREVWIGDGGDGISEIHGSLFTPDAHAVQKRLDGWRPRCVSTIRAAASSAAPTPWARWRPARIGWGVGAGAMIVRPARGRPPPRWSFT